MEMMMQRYIIPATNVYETVKSKTSSMDYPYAHVLEYSSYGLSISVLLTLKYILGWSILISIVFTLKYILR